MQGPGATAAQAPHLTVHRQLQTCLKLLERAYEIERTRQFYDALVIEVSAESPAVVERVVARLSALNERMGFIYAPFAAAGRGRPLRPAYAKVAGTRPRPSPGTRCA